MDSVLNNAWKAGAKPFDGETLACDDIVPVSALRSLLLQMVSGLKAAFPNAVLLKFDDWHQHDDFIKTSEKSNWKELDELLASDQSLHQGRDPDTYVRKAFYSQDGSFLVRFHIADETDDQKYPGSWGDCDITASPDVVQRIMDGLMADQRAIVSHENAQHYFDTRYAG